MTSVIETPASHKTNKAWKSKEIKVTEDRLLGDHLSDAIGITLLLLDESYQSSRTSVTFADIAAHKLLIKKNQDGTYNLTIAQARKHVSYTKMVHDSRKDIKSAIEEAGRFLLTYVSAENESVLSGGGKPSIGFEFRDSEVGRTDQKLQDRMTLGKVKQSLAIKRALGEPLAFEQDIVVFLEEVFKVKKELGE